MLGVKILRRPILGPWLRRPQARRRFSDKPPPSEKPQDDFQKILSQLPIKELLEDPQKIQNLARQMGVPEASLKNFLIQHELAQHKTTKELYTDNMEASDKEQQDKWKPDKIEEDPKDFFQNP